MQIAEQLYSFASFLSTLSSDLESDFKSHENLTFGLDSETDTKLYEVRTRRIITYSNVIASTSNILFVAMGTAIGVASDNPDMIKKSLKKLDDKTYIEEENKTDFDKALTKALNYNPNEEKEPSE